MTLSLMKPSLELSPSLTARGGAKVYVWAPMGISSFSVCNLGTAMDIDRDSTFE